ncbi:uncharacterized protein BXIN_1495 [Babesia sp. Xinjiang]|uniref:uncharacterized protein n=1 Tax=Babesia sp. Xinjiang TaxID=462227 RepID=UPI000A235FEF|nr:uncharacterized protein BXIN_1495 [Babesia sp. Xinjiang]ORM42254.1 hypothetical protein BXIN_1495 [Babesia sp. Xinjiang]
MMGGTSTITLRAFITICLLCVYVVYVPSHCSVVVDAPSSSTQPSPRFTGVKGIGIDERVEPSPTVRVYAYTPRGSFNPSSSLYADRITRALEWQAYRSEALNLKNLHSRLMHNQRRQLGRIIDASEKRG